MALKTFRTMPALNGVGASQTATLNLPIGLTYHGVLFTLGGTTMGLSEIDEMRVNANGRNIQTITGGADWDIMNRFDGMAGADTQLYLNFERYGLDTIAARELSVIGTGFPQNNDRGSAQYNPTPLSTLQIEIDIASGASAPTISAKALQSSPRPLGMIKHLRKFIYSPSASGDFEVSDLPKGLLIDKMYIKTANGNIDDLRIDRDNFRVFDRTQNENNLFQIDGVRVPITEWYFFDPSEGGDGTAAMSTLVNDLRFIFNMSASDTLTIYVSYLGPFAA